MIEAFVYPVSAVMKFWHWLLAGVFGMESSPSWVASVILLVVTIRGLIAPLQWYSFKTSRLLVLMRPRLAAIEQEYSAEVSAESIKAKEQATKAVHKEYQYNPFAGCVPALIQLPFFLGLYRLLLWMAVPASAGGRPLGVLSPAEVESFRESTLLGVPLPAYMSMTPEQFAHLGTTLSDVRALAVPMLVAAVCFTTFNMVVSQIRTRSTLEWGNPTAHRVYAFVWVLVPLAALGITIAGLTGLVPIALLLYWVSGNLWTLLQTVVLWYLVVRVFPLDDAHLTHMSEAKEAEMLRRRGEREKKRSRRRRKLSAVANPSTLPAVRRELQAEKAAEKAEKAEAKAEKKRRAAERRAAVKEANRLQREEIRKKPRS
ncbi:YidC/Oxa1 family membrane protein insertase [Corynebacterium mycetoides]|uniref:Membrane protein insertase YidC n=1 Tax=Corynebacterium mycetoides TaxID=38302 RepID=A0A1G9PJY0_9CORY|nr:membrane protein insertase YidC [Corynebacterium mycetoides]SDL99029.1 YidC/Oxa1 family membrane protein insertase [Corynebacterium mycetoides]